jgi:hypothetical protein
MAPSMFGKLFAQIAKPLHAESCAFEGVKSVGILHCKRAVSKHSHMSDDGERETHHLSVCLFDWHFIIIICYTQIKWVSFNDAGCSGSYCPSIADTTLPEKPL